MVNKFIIGVLCTLFIILFPSGSVFAHSGNLDSNGGHMDHTTGRYHYHRMKDNGINEFSIQLARERFSNFTPEQQAYLRDFATENITDESAINLINNYYYKLSEEERIKRETIITRFMYVIVIVLIVAYGWFSQYNYVKKKRSKPGE